MGSLPPVEDALLHHDDLEVVGESVHHGGPHAAAGSGPCDQERIHLQLVQITDEGGAEEDARLVIEDHDVALLRGDLPHDLVAVLGAAVKVFIATAVLAMPSTSRQGYAVARGRAVEDGDSLGPGGLHQSSDLVHVLPALLAAAITVLFDGLKDGFGDVPHKVVVDVHHDDRWPATKSLPLSVASGGKHLLVPFAQNIIPGRHECLL